MRKAAVVTLGCKVNQFESSSVSASLMQAGYSIVEQAVGVDLIIINTCTVTQKADQEALSLIRRLSRHNPGAKIVATGCLAQSNPELLVETGLVNLVLGQDEKADLVGYLSKIEHAEKPIIHVAEPKSIAADFGAPAPERTRAFYKIQDGCNAYCAYCAVPYSRGPSRSLPLDKVLAGIREYMVSGIPEVVLCGIHLGYWGRDLEPTLSLGDLFDAIDGELMPDEESFRMRLSSIEPLELDERIISAYEMYPWLAKHFHLPLQSGSDRILKLMGRPYNSSQFRDLVLKLKEKWPVMSIGVDVMAGFPGEKEEDFLATYNLLNELPISYFHVFPYSKRPGTPAAESPDQVPEHLKRERTEKLRELNKDKKQSFTQLNIGQKRLALIENTPHAPSGRLKILTDNYLYALLPPEMTQLEPGSIIPVTLKQGNNPWGLMETTL